MAEGIVDILKKDLDALTITLFEYLKQIPTLRDEMHVGFAEAYGLFVEAEMLTGSGKIEEISLASQSVDFDVRIATQEGILGLSLPTLQLTDGSASAFKPRFSLIDTPTKLDESALKIKGALNQAVKLAEIEALMREILEAISIKKRQINRIQHKILPQLDAAIRYIELILEETERQDAIRVRVLQRKRKERALKGD
jgi:V/A-type H+-transporting ATPase subunit D